MTADLLVTDVITFLATYLATLALLILVDKFREALMYRRVMRTLGPIALPGWTVGPVRTITFKD